MTNERSEIVIARRRELAPAPLDGRPLRVILERAGAGQVYLEFLLAKYENPHTRRWLWRSLNSPLWFFRAPSCNAISGSAQRKAPTTRRGLTARALQAMRPTESGRCPMEEHCQEIQNVHDAVAVHIAEDGARIAPEAAIKLDAGCVVSANHVD